MIEKKVSEKTNYCFTTKGFCRSLRDMSIVLEDLNLRDAERRLCQTALQLAGSIVEAAQLLGITRHALKRRIVKYRIEWPPRPARQLDHEVVQHDYHPAP
jgi:DNA-binding NtrC family response regulator